MIFRVIWFGGGSVDRTLWFGGSAEPHRTTKFGRTRTRTGMVRSFTNLCHFIQNHSNLSHFCHFSSFYVNFRHF